MASVTADAAIDVLVVEDREADFLLVSELLKEIDAQRINLDWEPDERAAVQRMAANDFDVCLVDYRLGRRTGIELLGEAQQKGYQQPFILMTGMTDRETDIAAMEAGAADFICKDELTGRLLERTIRYAVERNRTLRELAKTSNELASREREQFFKLELDLLCVGDYDGNFTRINPAWTRLLGYSEQALLDTYFMDLVHPDDRQKTTDAMHRIIAGAHIEGFENRYRTKAGDYRWLLWSATADTEHALIYATARDITDLKRSTEELTTARDELATQEERIRSLHRLTSRSDLDSDGKLREALEVGARLLGLDTGLLTRVEGELCRVQHCHQLGDVTPGAGFPLAGTRSALVTAHGRVVATTDVAHGVDSAAPAQDPEADAVAYIGAPLTVGAARYGTISFTSERPHPGFSASDLSFIELLAEWVSTMLEREVYEQQLVAARETAEAASRTKSAFLAQMSHEIRTPLNAVIGMTHLAQRTNLSPKQLDYLQKIDISAQLLLQLINDILDFSKIEAEKLDLEVVPFDLEELLSEIGTVIEPKAEQKHIELMLGLGPTCPRYFRGDPLRLKQILLNLADNAVKFTDTGEIAVLAELDGSDDDGATLHFSVRDSGVGIEPDRLPELFEAFRQAQSSTTRQFGGTGLGLAICQRLVELMGGTIWVDSTPQRGSIFHFNICLPVAADHEAGKSGDRDPLRFDIPAGTSVVVAAASLQARSMIEQLLEPLQLRVLCVPNLDQVQMARIGARQAAGGVDVYIVDWDLPPRGGIAAVSQMLDVRSARRVIMLAPCYRVEDVHRVASDHGIAHVVCKPWSAPTLYESLAGACAPVEPAPGTPPTIADAQVAPAQRRLEGAKILLVEDNAINQQIAIELLAREGATCEVAGDGQQAVDAVCRNGAHFDAVLMDVELPVLDGHEATRAIRKIERLRDLPIIGMTAQAMAEDRRRALDAGMIDYITKPIEPDVLAEVIARRIGAEQAR